LDEVPFSDIKFDEEAKVDINIIKYIILFLDFKKTTRIRLVTIRLVIINWSALINDKIDLDK